MAAATRLSPKDAKRARGLAGFVANDLRALAPSLDMTFWEGEARHFLLVTAPRDRVKRSPRAQGPTKAERKAATNVETAGLREQAMARAGGRCELCGREWSGSPGWQTEMAHLDGGSGKRSQGQWIGNVLMAHHRCHQGKRGLDKAPLSWVPVIRSWAARYGYPLPERFRKIEALRAHPGAEARSRDAATKETSNG
jgi:hypothetical protein